MHNGYTNYYTWVTALWLENTEATYNHYRGMYAELSEGRPAEDAAADLADAIREDMEDGNPLQGEANSYADILAAALQEINYQEIAARFADE